MTRLKRNNYKDVWKQLTDRFYKLFGHNWTINNAGWSPNICECFAQTLTPDKLKHSLFFDAKHSLRDQIFGDFDLRYADHELHQTFWEIFQSTRLKYMNECMQPAPLNLPDPSGYYAVDLGFDPPLQKQPDRRRRCNRLLDFPIDDKVYTWEKFDKWLTDQKNDKEAHLDPGFLQMIYDLPLEENKSIDLQKEESSSDVLSVLSNKEALEATFYAKKEDYQWLFDVSEKHDVELDEYKAWLADFSKEFAILLVPARLWADNTRQKGLILRARRAGYNKVANRCNWIVENYRFSLGHVFNDALFYQQTISGESEDPYAKHYRYMKLRRWAAHLEHPMDSFTLLKDGGFIPWLNAMVNEGKITEQQLDAVYMEDPPNWDEDEIAAFLSRLRNRRSQ